MTKALLLQIHSWFVVSRAGLVITGHCPSGESLEIMFTGVWVRVELPYRTHYLIILLKVDYN